MRKALIAIGLALLALFAFPTTAQAADCEQSPLGQVCVSLVGQDISVTLLGQEIVRIPAPVREVEIRVPGPRVTIAGPTINVPVPGPTRTIEVPGVSIPQPGPTVTVTVRPDGQIVRSRATVTSSSSRAESSVPTPTITETQNVASKPKEKVKEVKVSVPQAIGISAGLFLLGMLLGLLAIYSAYAIGYKNSEETELKTWEAFRNEILSGTVRKH